MARDATLGEEEEVAAAFAAERPRSRALRERAVRVMPGGVSHNLRNAKPFPVYYARGEGAWKWDVDGKRYVDYSLGSASLLLGHRHPAVVEALEKQAIGIASVSHELEVEWAEIVSGLLPAAERTRFTASGTEATMLAIRIARAVTGKGKIIHFKSHWHGWHDYFLGGYRPPFERAASRGVPQAVSETALLADEWTAEDDIARFAEQGDVAGIIVEPTGPSWGTVPLRPGLLHLLRELADRYGIVLIFDEMISGFRWSPGGIQALEGVTPDLVTIGKILGGGMPGGGIAGRADLMEQLEPGGDVDNPGILHYGTFNAHPLSAASGVATLREAATGVPQNTADAHAAAIRQGVGQVIRELGIKGFAYGASSAYHLYLCPADRQRDEVSVATTSAEDLLSIPSGIIERLQFEMRVRGVDLFSYNGGVASSAHGAEELSVTVEAFEGALTALRDAGLVATA